MALVDKNQENRLEVEAFGFTVRESDNYDIVNGVKGRVQVRADKDNAPRSEVARYKAHLAGGAVFPRPFVTRDGYIADGNTRITAATEVGVPTMDVFVIEADWGSATDEKRDELVAVGGVLNNKNGLPLNKVGSRTAAEAQLRLGWSVDRVAARLGLKKNTVVGLRKELTAVQKINDAGLDRRLNMDAPKIRNNALRALGYGTVLTLNNEPYKLLAELAFDASLTASEITTLAKEVKGLGSDEAAITRVSQIRVEPTMAERIRRFKLEGNAKQSHASHLRQHMGFAMKFHAKPNELVEQFPGARPQHVDMLQGTIGILQQTLALQLALDAPSTNGNARQDNGRQRSRK